MNRLNRERFLILDDKRISYGGNQGVGEHTTLHTPWKIIKDDVFTEQAWILWDDVLVATPKQEDDYDRYSDFMRYMAQSYNIPYRL